MEVAIQPTFTCSKLIIETLEQGVKYVQSYLVNFDQVIFGWAETYFGRYETSMSFFAEK